ncbi:hypothetical protein AUP68_04333 [Ilyonectria robusta]
MRACSKVNPSVPIVLMLFGHGTRSLGIYLDYSKQKSNDEALLRIDGLQATIDPRANITFITTAYYSGGSAICPDLNKRTLRRFMQANAAMLVNSCPGDWNIAPNRRLRGHLRAYLKRGPSHTRERIVRHSPLRIINTKSENKSENKSTAGYTLIIRLYGKIFSGIRAVPVDAADSV